MTDGQAVARPHTVNLEASFAKFDGTWAPRIIGAANGQLIKIARAAGELVWHTHTHEDEVFLVQRGELRRE